MEKALENLKTEPKSSHGGFREGSGRKPRLQYSSRELFNNFIDDHWSTIEAKMKLHIRKGNPDFLRWIIEQRMGKAPQGIMIVHEPEPDLRKKLESLEKINALYSAMLRELEFSSPQEIFKTIRDVLWELRDKPKDL